MARTPTTPAAASGLAAGVGSPVATPVMPSGTYFDGRDDDRAALAADRLRQEAAPDAPRRALHVISQGYRSLQHPETGILVTFVPGEALPEWAALAIAEDAR